MKRLFDQYIAVDWSARNSPSPAKPSGDAIWVAVKKPGANLQEERYFRTRYEAEAWILGTLRDSVSKGERTLIGYDFDFGFPAGFGESLGLAGSEATWLQVWKLVSELIEDGADNSNNRFDVAEHINALCSVTDSASGPFWGTPRGSTYPHISAKKSLTYPFTTSRGKLLREKRWTELREPKSQPVWKLIGSASVGGQTLVGIPMLYRLRFNEVLSEVSKVWPFETGFSLSKSDSALIYHVEIWPGIFSKELRDAELIKDQAQVRLTVDWLCGLDVAGELYDLMNSSEGLSVAEEKECVEEEGWIIGMGRGK